MLWNRQDGKPTASEIGASKPSDKIGKYKVLGEVGRGACGIVYKGFDPFVQRDVAIKIATTPADALEKTRNKDHERAFFAEARAAGMLSHPHIVSLYDAGAEGELSYLVMEFVDGDTLTPLCKKDGPRATIDQVVDIGFKCAKALDYAHIRGVLHRDIKPGNIMLTKDGVPKLMDFSIAMVGAQVNETQDKPVGSPRYMSPEQTLCQALGPQSDLYSLGAVLYQLLTGEPPFTSNDAKQLFHDVAKTPASRVESLRPDVPKPLSDIITRLLMKNPNERFQSGNDLAMELTRLFNQLRLSGQQIARRESRDSLRSLRFFDTFSDEEIEEILKASVINNYAPGDFIIQEGDIDHAFYIMVEGNAEVRKNGKPLSTLVKGACVGEIGFLGAARRTASVVAVGRVLALKVNATLMEQVSQECQLRFYKVFTETLIYRLSMTSAKLSSMTG
jgi:serine/threonine protein kinase